MNKLQRIAERRQVRTAKLTAKAGMSLADALRRAASMSEAEQQKFVEDQLAAMGKTKLQFLAGTAGEALKKVKDAILPKKQAAVDGMTDIKDNKYDNIGPMATRVQAPPSELKQNLQRVSSVFGILSIVLLTGGFLVGLFEPENRETITQLKPLLATFGTGAISLLLHYAANKVK